MGCCTPSVRGAGSPSNRMSPRLRPLPSYQVLPQYIGRKNEGCAPFFGGGMGSWVPMQHNVACAKAYLRAKWHIDPSSRLATIDIGRKFGAVPLFWGGRELGPHLAQCGLSRGLPPCRVARRPHTSITANVIGYWPCWTCRVASQKPEVETSRSWWRVSVLGWNNVGAC